MRHGSDHVYIVGAGFSAGLGFPTIGNLLHDLWPSLKAAGLADDVADVIRFHHPAFNAALPKTFPNIETLLSEMQANEQLFASSRAATGKFTPAELILRRQGLLSQIAEEFHDLHSKALSKKPNWLVRLAERMKGQNAQIVSFNWDLVLDELLFGDDLSRESYGFSPRRLGPRLLKPHGSLNWYEHGTGRHLKRSSKFRLCGADMERIYAFRRFRSPVSSRRSYMPLIIPPLFSKTFDQEIFHTLWQEAVEVLSTAASVTFLGYSLANADFHARFILRCGFHNQIEGVLKANGRRKRPTGRAAVTVVDKDASVGARIADVVGWPLNFENKSIEEWVDATI